MLINNVLSSVIRTPLLISSEVFCRLILSKIFGSKNTADSIGEILPTLYVRSEIGHIIAT